MIVPLVATIYYSLFRYNIQRPDTFEFWGAKNYYYFLTDPAFITSLLNTFILVGGVIAISIVGGILLGILMNKEFYGRGIARLMVIGPFFVMPSVAALIWKHMFMNSESGLFAIFAKLLGAEPIQFLTNYPLASIVVIVAWQWLAFATLILLTALQSLDQEQMEAAEMDGASALARFRYLTVPHLARPITIIILIETIFLLAIFAEIFVTTAGGPGNASTNLPWIIYKVGRQSFDAGGAAAGGIIAVIVANIFAIVLVKIIGKNLDG
ncbi:UNVERIFIED_CONTAM: hypothetical protein GTU68_054841 [Idotea baltica]|nr:hypothetical protein [Idotea baltica]